MRIFQLRISLTAQVALTGLMLLTMNVGTAHAQWRWPVLPAAVESTVISQPTISPWWSVSGAAAENEAAEDEAAEDEAAEDEATVRTYRFLSDGDVIYHDTMSDSMSPVQTVPRTDNLVIIGHDNGFWTFYAGAALDRLDSSWSGGEPVDQGSTFQAEGKISFAIYDAVRQVFVNPRAILPEQQQLPEDGLPVVGFLQDGELTLSRNLTAGAAQFVILQEWMEPLELPRKIYVLVDGLVEAEVDFTLPGEVADRMTPTGDVMLTSLHLDPGLTLVEIEVHQFDGRTQRRTIPIRVPESVVLDTP